MSRTTTQPEQRQAQVAALVAAQGAARASLTAQAQAQAVAAVQGFGGWYDTAAITAWAATLAAQVEGLQRASAQTADAYLARVLTVLTGRHVRPVGRVDVTDLRNGTVTHAGAYGRAADAYRWQQSQFDSAVRSLLTAGAAPKPFGFASPLQAAADRAAAVADMDVQLADRAQTTAVYSQHGERKITGYRRVIHPELSRGGTCGLCVAASDRLYGVREPKPIHARCACTTLPVVNGIDPGSALNQGDLGRLYEEAGNTGAAKLKATRYRLDEHGELGPLLSKAGAPVRTEKLADRQTVRPPRKPKSDAERAATVRRIRAEYAQALPMVRGLAEKDPDAWGGSLRDVEARIKGLDGQLAA